ncbi:tripartite tricarboxylate transporter substrate binding protein [Pigmentiphaga soli]|uniref:Tripartite tricarboxylate transporter substrate binding protein n=1 Tax=Pigmentiphaga soli TaxID=1007095 RepID=A0ABP8H8N5_9BURK
MEAPNKTGRRPGGFARPALAWLAGVFLAASFAGASAADDYPVKPIRLIVPYVAGGGADNAARALAEVMSKSLGQPIVIENRGGASAIVGTTVAAKADPDGYTILYGTDANLVLNSFLYKNLSYDPDKDFVPIGLVAEVPQMMAINPAVPARNIKEFIAYAKAHPGELNYSSPGRGGNGDLAGEMFMQAFGVKMQSINFKGGGDALLAVLGNTVQVYFGTTAIAVPHIKAGKLIPIAAVTLKRQAAIPDVPTVAESGAPGFESTLRVGLVALAKTPAPIVKRLNKALNEALANPEFRKRLVTEGYEPAAPNTPEEYAAINQRAKDTWGKIIRERNISLD